MLHTCDRLSNDIAALDVTKRGKYFEKFCLSHVVGKVADEDRLLVRRRSWSAKTLTPRAANNGRAESSSRLKIRWLHDLVHSGGAIEGLMFCE